MNKHILAIVALLFGFGFCQAKILDVRSFGAVGDGKSIDSDAIDCAIAEASRHKGDTVFLPEGRYSCYSIHLKSNILKNIRMTLMNPDERPEIYKKDVSNMSVISCF